MTELNTAAVRSATIIAFPQPKPVAPVVARQPDPRERLARALAALDRAVAEQRTAVAKWRDSLAELRGSLQGLGQSLGTYNARLGTLAQDVGGLNRQARQMEALADSVLANQAAAD